MNHLDFYNKEIEKVNKDLVIKERIINEINKLQESKESVQQLKDLKYDVALLLKNTSDAVRDEIKETIEDVVTYALQSIFKENYKFAIVLDENGLTPTAEFKVISYIRGEELEEDPFYSKGGGITDVIAIALRIILTESFAEEGFIYFDEPAKMLSAGNMDSLANFIVEISQQFDRQILINTHSPVLASCGDKKYRVKKINGYSNVTTY